MNKVKVTLKAGNITVSALLLAVFDCKYKINSYKKRLFGILGNRPITKTITKRQQCLVFIPWKHQMKELVVVNLSDLASEPIFATEPIVTKDSFYSRYEEDEYFSLDYKITNFKGLDLICRYPDMLAEIMSEPFVQPYASLQILYDNYPQFLAEQSSLF